MKNKITDIIRVDSTLSTPIYKQIIQSICDCIEKGRLHRNDMLPSVNSIAETFSLARGSVFTAYNDLRSCGIIDSIPGKGYYITSTILDQKKHVFLLFDVLNERSTALYNSITSYMGDACKVEMYFHRNNLKIFESQIKHDAVRFNTYIISPVTSADISGVLSGLDTKHLFLIDNGKEYRKAFNGVYRNTEKELSQLFQHFNKNLGKYKRVFIVVSPATDSGNITTAFKKIAKNLELIGEVINNMVQDQVKKGDAFIVFDDVTLVNLVKWCKAGGLKIGKDVGIVSYFDNILKEGIADGITSFCTDIEHMGKSIARMACSGGNESIEAPVIIHDRFSF